MEENRTTPTPETDDSGNPTQAAPESVPEEEVIEMPGPETIEEPAETSNGTDDQAGSTDPSGSRRPDVQQMVSQLQHMIDQLATQASPALKEVAAKAAELAAAAANRAGPIAHKAAGMTESVGQRVATKSSQVAANLRTQPSGPDTATATKDEEAVGE
ncbi:MAG: hypothetical protein M3432_03385 [Chloroflexota bacterium]|nr:hypothetical protein [Chloroflexota bacterium]